MGKTSRLAAYTAKRDFAKTAEPRDAAGVIGSERLRFVVQRHAATRLHYDLRLELDGVFKSWAVTKGPSLDPADKRLAVETEDHPLAYGDFEGTIPKGQYGGGTVQLFDRGFWEPQGDMPPAEALKAGELKFALEGVRLKGSFVLVRMKTDKLGGKLVNWLLIKHRDAWATQGVEGGGVTATTTSVASGRTLASIAKGGGKAPEPFMLAAVDASADAVGGREDQPAAPKTEHGGRRLAGRAVMPDFVAPQLCRSVAVPPSGQGWLHEIKFDGYRVQARVEAARARLLTRKGLDWSAKFPALATAAARLPDGIYDGEIVALEPGGLPDFSALQAAIALGRTDDLVLFLFDQLYEGGADLRRQPLLARKARLAAALEPLAGEHDRRLRLVEHFDSEGADVYATARAMELEGIVSKKRDSVYRSGRSDSWTKAKCRPGHEIVLGGWSETEGRFRSLLGGVYRDGTLAYVGRIGTGFSDAVVERLRPSLERHRATKNPFGGASRPSRDRTVRWLDPVLVAEVTFAGFSADGQMRQASFKGLREDKPAAEVRAGAPRDAAPPAMRGRAAPRAAATICGVPLTHPDKTLWPDAGNGRPATKRDLAAYLAAVGEAMLPFIAGRPCSIVRAPDGIEAQSFFQRHAMAGGSPLLDTVTLSGDRQPYLVLNSVEALVAVAQSGGLELHPSNCRSGAPEVPGRLVFDLDPAPDVAFPAVIAAARTLKEVLGLLGLASFAKTTGGKGLHVVVPLAGTTPEAGWKEAKSFAQRVCRAMESDAPDRYLTVATKAKRAGRIYLDYLRNDRLSTAVAPFSPRARAHAPVSMPLTWSQVRVDLEPLRFTIATVPGLIARRNAWEGFSDAAAPLADAIVKLRKI